MRKLAATLSVVLLAVVLASSSFASSSYGKGRWSYAEFLRLKPGMTKRHVERRVCGCTGLGLTGGRVATIFYNNDVQLGYVEVIYRGRPRRARNAWWCGMPPGQGGCERSWRFK